jgi:Gliding motility associated protein GldN
MKLQKIFLTLAVLFTVTVGFSQTKKKPAAKKKTGVTVQKPADAPVTTVPDAPAVVNKPTATTPTPVPMAEREVITIPEQPVAKNNNKKPNLSSGAERVIVDSLSVHPIDPSNVLYRITNWRRMDLKEKMNQPFFSKNNEITKFLIEGVKSGVITAYANDSVSTVLSMEAFTKNMQMEDMGGDALSDEEKKAGFGDAAVDDGWGNAKPSSTTPAKKDGKKGAATPVDDGWGTPTTPTKTTPTTAGTKPAATKPGAFDASGATPEYFARDLTILEIKEDYIFDKQRSRAYNSIQTISIVIPAEKTVKGFDVPVASFRYKDLDQYFRSNPKCVWYNFQNIAQHKNMADAFDLRLFSARIIKQSNPGDAFLVDIYKGEKAGLRASEQLEYKLMEFEHNLWEY